MESYDDGFDDNGIHKDTGTHFDPQGYTFDGFDKNHIHRDTHTKYDPQGYDWYGRDKDGHYK